MANMSDDVTGENEAKTPDIQDKPEGADFCVPLPDGHVVWFKEFSQGQRLMLLRASDLSRADRQRIQGGPGSDKEKFKALSDLVLKADKRMWDAIDSRVLNPEDVEKIMDAMIADTIDIEWAWTVFRGGADPVKELDDDQELIPEVKPSRRANVKRTQVR